MANIVCYPHYAAGALICDIMLEKMSPIGKHGAIDSKEHRRGKFNDTDSISIIPSERFQRRIDYLKSIGEFTGWIGTHAWPGELPLDEFEQVLLITTTTSRSKIYRWSRALRHYFLPTWGDIAGQDLLDKARETAKNYIIPFNPVFRSNVINIEFADVVECTPEFLSLIQGKDYHDSMRRWKEVNKFLYAPDFWDSFEVKTFYQAEVEQNLKRYYIYNN